MKNSGKFEGACLSGLALTSAPEIVGEFKTVADSDDAPCGRGSEPEGSSMVQRLDGRERYEAANGVCLEAWPDGCGGIAAAAAS